MTTYRIEWENVLSGATGTYKESGKVLEFDTLEEAEAFAADLQTERNLDLGLTPEDGDVYLYEPAATV